MWNWIDLFLKVKKICINMEKYEMLSEKSIYKKWFIFT